MKLFSKERIPQMYTLSKLFLILVVAVWFGLSSQPARQAKPDLVIMPGETRTILVHRQGTLQLVLEVA